MSASDLNTSLPTLDAQIENWFTFHPVKPGQAEKYTAIREAAKTFAKVIAENTPRSADQTAALRKIRETVMTANASVALEGK